MSSIEPRRWLVRADEIAKQRRSFSHPWNPKSEVVGTRLSQLVQLTRTGVSLVQIPPGKESFVYHAHHCEEEWIYILAGRGIVEIDGQEHEVGSGDFMGFPTPSVPHHLRNPFDAELVYLMGGESRELEIADFPRHNRRMVRRGSVVEVYPLDAGKPFGPLDPAK
jgi:uncharacterized cupin superfamily protein